MSAESRVASRYAKALIEQASEKNILEDIKKDIDDLNEVCEENRSLTLALSSPLLKSDKKSTILKSIFDGKYHELTIQFFELVCRKERAAFLPSIGAAFIEEYNEINQIQLAELHTTTEVSKKTESEFVRVVTEMTNRKADLKKIVSPDLIGGFILKIGDKQLDDSVKSKLTRMKRQFADS